MPGFVLTVASRVFCSHAGKATPTMPSTRVVVLAQPLVTIASPYAIAGCGLTGTPNPPCATGQFTSGATRVFSLGQPVAIGPTASSNCIPTGSPMIVVPAGQTRVIAS